MLETLSQMAGEYNEEQLRTMGFTDEEIAQIQKSQDRFGRRHKDQDLLSVGRCGPRRWGLVG